MDSGSLYFVSLTKAFLDITLQPIVLDEIWDYVFHICSAQMAFSPSFVVVVIHVGGIVSTSLSDCL